MMKWMERRVVRHVIFWLLYWLVMGFVGGRYDLQFARAYMHEGIELPLRMMMVYIVLSRSAVLENGKWWRWLAEVLIVLLLTTLASRILMYCVIYPILYKADYTIIFWDERRLIFSFLDLALTLFVVLALRFARKYMDFAAQKQQLLLEKTTAELHALRNQTNPHFLFNTLTNIYTLARKNAPETAEVVLRLSKLMRYILYECDREHISLGKEIQIIEEYIALEKLRFGQRVTVNGTLDIDDPEQPIAPLLLLPLFENAFKHGAGESRFAFLLEWELVLKNGHLYFRIHNTREKGNDKPDGDGIGLRNLKKQLALLYPGQYQLAISGAEDYFTVNLTIQLLKNG